MSKKTFCMIKPDAVKANRIFDILQHLTDAGFSIHKIKKTKLTHDKIVALYDEHKEKGFFPEIVEFISSEEVVVLELHHENAVPHLRDHLGATKSWEAAAHTIRGKWGNKESVMENCIHGSDSDESAARELQIMFA